MVLKREPISNRIPVSRITRIKNRLKRSSKILNRSKRKVVPVMRELILVIRKKRRRKKKEEKRLELETRLIKMMMPVRAQTPTLTATRARTRRIKRRTCDQRPI